MKICCSISRFTIILSFIFLTTFPNLISGQTRPTPKLNIEIPKLLARVNGVEIKSKYIQFRLSQIIKRVNRPLTVKEKTSIVKDLIEKEKNIYIEQAKDSKKPDNVIEKIVEGKMEKYFQEICLLEQPFIKDSDKTVKDLITEAIATLGENITVGRYTRFAIGESHNDS